ncbi:MAG: hypothetical protein ACRBFS_07685 [Aureispira sp.]
MKNSKTNVIHFKRSEGNPKVGYVQLPLDEIEDRTVATMVDLADLIEGYQGVPVYLDFNKNKELLGIEIVG